MKESNTPVGNADNNSLKREILLNTKGEYMKESNTLVGKNSLKKEILVRTKGQYMMVSNTHAGNANIKQHLKEVLQDITMQYMKGVSNLVGKYHKTHKKSFKVSITQHDKKFVQKIKG